MGACIYIPKPKKPKNESQIDSKILPLQAKPIAARNPQKTQVISVEPSKPSYKKIAFIQLLTTYQIQNTTDLASKLQGPKYLSNLIDGSARILRVVDPAEIKIERLNVYVKLLNLQVYEDNQGNLILFDEYCSGSDLLELLEKFKDAGSQQSKKDLQQMLLNFIKSIFECINRFHQSEIWLGNLSVSSFRLVSDYSDRVRLVDFNLSGSKDPNKMGFAFNQGFSSDWEYLGYMLMLIFSDQAPMFIHHKLQYIQFSSMPNGSLIQQLLRGKRCVPNQFDAISTEKIIDIDPKTRISYLFRRDLNRLLKMRKKRKAHNIKYYGKDVTSVLGAGSFSEEGMHRLEAERIFNGIKRYIDELNKQHEQPCISYGNNGERFRKLRQVFILPSDKKLNELKQVISSIK